MKPAKADIRRLLYQGVCPWCGEGPFKAVLSHVSHAHGVTATDVRERAGINRTSSLTSPEYHANRLENGRRIAQRYPENLALGGRGRVTMRSGMLRDEGHENMRRRSQTEECREHMRCVQWLSVAFFAERPELRQQIGVKGGSSGWTEERREALRERNRTPEMREHARQRAVALNAERCAPTKGVS